MKNYEGVSVSDAAAELVVHLRDRSDEWLNTLVNEGSDTPLVRKVRKVAMAILDERWTAELDLDSIDPFPETALPEGRPTAWGWGGPPDLDLLHPDDAAALRRRGEREQGK